jgi:hypothetical protein
MTSFRLRFRSVVWMLLGGVAASGTLWPASPSPPLAQPRRPDGDGQVIISGELKQWHKVTLTLSGPFAHELDNDPNPFSDYRFTVTFQHASGSPRYEVPGYFAADGAAAHSSAAAGTRWRAHLSPDKPGRWTYRVSFVTGKHAAVDPDAPSRPVATGDRVSGSFKVDRTDKVGRDLRAQGRLQYVGQHHLRFAGTGRYFLKAGADAPENLLAYVDFDGTSSRRPNTVARPGEATAAGLHVYAPHAKDWRRGDPTWQREKGRNLIGALNYLASKGVNAFSFLPYNVGGDGNDVWPFVAPEDKLHYDCSKLDQWQIVFDHAQSLGLYLHFKLQETEIDDDRRGAAGAAPVVVKEALDGGDLGVERKLYCRELIARFAHELALNWNLGEENTQSPEQQRAMAQYLRDTDPYDHLIVVHTYPDWQDRVYPPLLGAQSVLSGASLQNSWSAAHQRTLQWVTASAQAGKPWVVAHDEQNPPEMGVPPDPGYQGHSGIAVQGGKPYTLDDIRKFCLWGTLLAGGAGVEYYFGYKLAQNDLGCEDWRSRDLSWEYCRIALEFFHHHRIPFWEMRNADALIGNPDHTNSRYCFALPGECYLVYLPSGGNAMLDLSGLKGQFKVRWFNPRLGGPLVKGTVTSVPGGVAVSIGMPPAERTEDWLAVIRR